jgi:hypothetical protein
LILETKNTIKTDVLSKSDIWNQEYISILNRSKKSTHFINQERSNYLIPATELTNENLINNSKIPVVLVQNSKNDCLESANDGALFTGWDIIVPNSWAMAFWLCMIHFGARAIGQNELNYLNFESSNLSFPNEFSDTEAGRLAQESSKLELFKKYMAKPPSKRVNYLKKGFLNPFHCPFNSLLNVKMNSSSNVRIEKINYFILRDRQIISKLNDLFSNRNKQQIFRRFNELLKDLNEDIFNQSYVGVRLVASGGGKFENNSLLYSLGQKQEEKSQNIQRSAISQLIKVHRTEAIKKLRENNDTNLNESISNLNKLLRTNFNKYDLLRDESAFETYHIETTKKANLNAPIGFIKTSGYTLFKGKCSANGFILFKSIIELVKSAKSKNSTNFNRILFKTPSGVLFRQAKIENFYL